MRITRTIQTLRAAARAASSPARARFVALAFLLAPIVARWLGRLGLEETVRKIRSTPQGRVGSGVDALEGERLVAGVYRRHVVGGQCLSRSLVQFWIHHLYGDDVSLVIGVKPGALARMNLDAHAWVEPTDAPRDEGHTPLARCAVRGPFTELNAP